MDLNTRLQIIESRQTSSFGISLSQHQAIHTTGKVNQETQTSDNATCPSCNCKSKTAVSETTKENCYSAVVTSKSHQPTMTLNNRQDHTSQSGIKQTNDVTEPVMSSASPGTSRFNDKLPDIIYEPVSPPSPGAHQRTGDQRGSMSVTKQQLTNNNSNVNPISVIQDHSTTQLQPTPRPSIEGTGTNNTGTTDQARRSYRSTRSVDQNSRHDPLPVRYQIKKCLLIHDSTFKHYDQAKFSNEFNIRKVSPKSLSVLLKEKDRLKREMDKFNPHCIIIHLGSDELLKSRSDKEDDRILDNLWNLLWFITGNKSITANICLSLVIPTIVIISLTTE